MDSAATTTFALALIALAGGLLYWHARSWRCHLSRLAAGKPDLDSRFAWRQCRRRLQASGMLGLAGGGMFVGQFVPVGLLWLLVWAAVVLLLAWALLLAVVDGLDTKQYFRRAHQAVRAEAERWQGEVQQSAENERDH